MALRFLLVFVLLLAGRPACANMASPFVEGSRVGTAFTSRDVDILSEKLLIRLLAGGQLAKYIVTYTVKSDVAGSQIPLLFVARDYADSFRVLVDGRPVQVQPVSNSYTRFAGSPYAAFERAKEGETAPPSEDQVYVSWEHSYASMYRLQDLKYFQTALSKGQHTIQVSYLAHPWSNRSKWVMPSEFRYSLSPAKHWRSFGSLEVTVEQEDVPQTVTGNFGSEPEKWNSRTKTRTFNKLPADFIAISTTPVVSATATFFATLEPLGIGLLFTAPLFILLHLWAIKKYRKAQPQKRFSPVLIWGNLLLPLLWIVVYLASFSFIDWLVGPAAGGRYGYNFLMIFLYPFMLPLYSVVMWLVDKFWKHRYSQNSPA